MLRFLIVICMIVTIGSQLSAQIVNMERLRKYIGDRHFAVEGGLNFNYDNNNGRYVYKLFPSAALLYKFKDKAGKLNNKILLIGNYNLIRSQDQDFKNNWFVHLRFNKEITEVFRVESFVQSQENKLLSISSRNLIGGGVRIKLIEALRKAKATKSLHTYLGIAYMYEIENSEQFNVDFNNHRLSSYLFVSFDFGTGKPKIYNTLYMQPLFKDFNNHRISEDFSADFPLSKAENVKFNVLFNYFLNTNTPTGDSEYDSTISFGFIFNFQSKAFKKDKKVIYRDFPNSF